MSLCNTFRLFAASLVLVGFVCAPVATFALRRTTTFVNLEDLFQDQSVNVGVKYHAKRPAEFKTESQIRNESLINANVSYVGTVHGNDQYKQDLEVSTQRSDLNSNKSTFSEVTVSATVKEDYPTTLDSPNTTEGSAIQKETLFETTVEDTPPGQTVSSVDAIPVNTDTNSHLPSITKILSNLNSLGFNDAVTVNNTDSTNENTKKIPDTTDDNNRTSSSNTNSPVKPTISSKYSILKSTISPTWKKYTQIERKRPSTTEETPHANINEKDETIARAETVQSIFSLQNIITSNIPSLEQLKNDLLASSTSALRVPQSPTDPNVMSTTIIQTESIENPDVNTTEPLTSAPATEISTNKPSNWDTVESKRAGYLDFSEKNVNKEASEEITTEDLKLAESDNLRAMFEPESADHEIVEEKNISRLESQSQLNEDALKEELLKEELISDTEENAMRNEEKFNSDVPPSSPDISELSTLPIETQPYEFTLNVSNEDILRVKPINTEKKDPTFYTVSPNYKPLKKLDVQPPKQFVRDPDDNSWRNESISSLGIVFNPKNSSKPFTQVLKNKTETEWNFLFDKESKTDIPDLRERLEKMAKIRKTKKKKTDSLGNVVYVDYEENSSSSEISSKEDFTTSTPFYTTTTSPFVPEVYSTETSTTVPTNKLEAPVIDSTTNEIPKQTEKDKNSDKKSKVPFNLPEYYESIDEDDIDYLNLAKIDLKKHVTEKQNVVLVTPRPKPFVPQKTKPNNIPEKVRTVQHFPPLTTQNVNIDEYDNDFKFKIDSFTTSAPSTNVLPISQPKTTNPVVNNIGPRYNSNSHKFTPPPIPKKTILENNGQFSNRPQHTAKFKNEYTIINDDVNFNRESSIRNYGDFVNEAAKDSEYDKNADFFPYTPPPVQSITVNDIVKVDQGKDHSKVNEAFDYDSQFRRDVIDRFVENFNRNSERFRPDFPVLFNSSIVHNDAHQDGRDVASSRSFLRGLYGSASNNNHQHKTLCEPNCDNVTVELSPAYELHYYIPEQEEKEEADTASITIPFQYKL